MRPRWRSIFSGAVLAAAALAVSTDQAPLRAEQPALSRGGRPAGESATVLPDGSVLLIGGETDRAAVAVRRADGRVVPLSTAPLTPRAWHTATLLADGSVLVTGGIDARGRTLAAPERFVPGTATFEALPADGFAPRAHHTATLLTDGRVLLVGGIGGGALDDADIWDPVAQTARPLGSTLDVPRAGHSADLQADGRVLITGGDSSKRDTADLFDPSTGEFHRAGRPGAEPRLLYATFVSPADRATDVPLDAGVTLRFSLPVNVRSVALDTIRLTGPNGAETVFLVPAEDGRLVFARPVERLQPSAVYRLTVDGLVTPAGQRVAVAAFSFTTKDEDAPRSPGDDDAWEPNVGNGWRSGREPSPWQTLAPLTAPPGTTALAGHVLKLDGRPLADVTLSIDGHETRSDRTGRFLLLLPGLAAGRHQLEIEGSSANRPGRTYGFFEAGLTIVAGQTNVLPYTIWMTRLDTAHTVRIASPTTRETVITTPFVPGLELHLPAGTVITGEDGRVVREIGITPIPLDRPPFPLPKNVEVPIYFTIQPGGAYVSNVNASGPKGAQVVYPNYRNLATGIVANFWHYDPEVKDWYVYGSGVVKGPQVFPDGRTRLYAFTGAMFTSGWTPPAWWPPAWWWPFGDPVDVSSGLFVLDQPDLSLADVIPLTLRRTYRPADSATRPFGIGATHDYAMFLWSAHQYTEVDLILPNGARVHYERTSSGTGWVDAVFEHTTSPTRFFKSTIAWNGNGWDLRLRDGTVYVFGDNTPLQAIRDRFGNTVQIQHASGQSGNVTRVTSPNGRWIGFTYDGSDRITQAADNIGRTVGYQYDGSGRLWKVTDPKGGVTEYSYDASHRLLTIKDPRNIVYLTNQYDANNRVTLQTQADSTTYQFAYTLNGSGAVSQTDVTDPRGQVSRFTFNSSGYPTSRIQAVGLTEQRTTTYTRAATSNRLTAMVDPLGRQTDYGYDSLGNLTSRTRLAGTLDAVTTTRTYEPTFSQMATFTDPLSHTTSFGYDAQGRLTTRTDPLSHATTFTYNSAGQMLTATNAMSETTTLGYDHGDLSSILDGLNQPTTWVRDAAGRVVRVIDPAGRQTQYAYDAVNRVTGITNSLGGQTTFAYDANSNLLSLTDALTHATTYTYDLRDRVATRTDPLTEQDSYVYDGQNNLTQITDRKGQVTGRTYDPLDRLSQVTFDDASTITYTYDAGDRLTQIADSINGTITRTYDGLNRLTQEMIPQATVDYTYDAAGRRATMTVSGQAAVSYSYDNANRLTAVTKGTATVSLAYDNANRRTTATFPNGIVGTYGYDAASHVTSLTYTLGLVTLGDLTYGYDASGNRTSVGGSWAQSDLPAAVGSATYDAANRIATWGAASFSFDLNGNLTGDGTDTYTWNARDQLVGLSGGSSASFQYDGAGRRRGKTIAGTTTRFVYDRLNMVQEQTSGGTPTANLLTGRRIDETWMRTDAGGAATLLVDALGSTRALADSNGAIQTDYTYEPYGRTTSTGTASGNSIGFSGREADGTGLLFYRARYYDPRSQRFISEDPLGYHGGGNLFAYAGNSPAMFTDPLGLKPRKPFGPPGLDGPPEEEPPDPGGDPGHDPGGDPGHDPGGEPGHGGDPNGPIKTHAVAAAALSGMDLAAEAAESVGVRGAAAGAGAVLEIAIASEVGIDLYRLQRQRVQDRYDVCMMAGNLSCGPPPFPNPKK
jgi:RHS repeat-associated protein